MFGFLAQLLAWCFDVVPNYAVAITLDDADRDGRR